MESTRTRTDWNASREHVCVPVTVFRLCTCPDDFHLYYITEGNVVIDNRIVSIIYYYILGKYTIYTITITRGQVIYPRTRDGSRRPCSVHVCVVLVFNC